MDETLNTLFDDAQHYCADTIALIDPPNREELVGGMPQSLSFAELHRHSERLARQLLQAGLNLGDRVLMQLPNTVEIVVSYLACAKLGLIISPVAVQYGQHELKHVIDTVKPAAYLSTSTLKGEPLGGAHRSLMPSHCACLMFDGASPLTIDAAEVQHEDYLRYQRDNPIDAHTLFTLCWTSGTTGRSKGVPRTHAHWMASTQASIDAMQLPEGSVVLNPFPFINMAAIGGFLYYWLKAKLCMVLHHPFDPNVFLQQVQEHKVHYTVAPPAVLNLLVQQQEALNAQFDLSSLKKVGSGSAPLAPTMIKGMKEHFGIEVANIFGSNEGMALISSVENVPSPDDRAVYFLRHWGSMKSRLISLDTGEEIISPGEAGELHIQGPTVFDGYYQSDEDNAEVFVDGYFKTGDLFEIAGAEAQFYQFKGRCKDIIVRGGVNISPEELDAVLSGHPSIQEAAVCAYPDDVLGEKIAAVIVASEVLSLQQLSEYLGEQGVAKFKWPERLKQVQALPRNAMNKVVRAELLALL